MVVSGLSVATTTGPQLPPNTRFERAAVTVEHFLTRARQKH